MVSYSGSSTPSLAFGANSDDGQSVRPYLHSRQSAAVSIRSALSNRESGDRHELGSTNRPRKCFLLIIVQMVKYIYRKCAQSKWLEYDADDGIDSGTPSLGVILKRYDGEYVTEPATLSQEVMEAVARLGCPVAFTLSSEVTHMLLRMISTTDTEVRLDNHGTILPVVSSVNAIGTSAILLPRGCSMCLCLEERFVLVWSNTAQSILAKGSDVETQLVGVVWGAPIRAEAALNMPSAAPETFRFPRATEVNSYFPRTPDQPQARVSRLMDFQFANPTMLARESFNPSTNKDVQQKLSVIRTAIEQEEMGDKVFDAEKESQEAPKRPFLLIHAILIGLAIALVIIVELGCVSKLLTEWRLDGQMLRFALMATIPVFGSFSLFFMIVITGSLFQLFGPISGVEMNSTYFSAKAPKIGRHKDYELPHITIEMPVYKEGLKGVIIPTVQSVMAAVKHYEIQGGTATIYINDDGMQIVKPELAEARKVFYELNNIGWCSRPAHCTDKKVIEEFPERYFERKGKFKKASNMNYCLDFSIRVEDEMLRLFEESAAEKGRSVEELTVDDETKLYEQARNNIVEHDGGKTQAAGDVRLGEIILLIDSDTRVPEDCLIYGALEMHESPEVALLQHASGIMQVVNNAFENGITYFTNLIYTSIQFAVGNGDVAPFVGHNTFIRWKAIQSIAWQEDGVTKFWSDSHVSEDFDVSLRLQMNNFVVRMAAYHKGAFKEGVSLTVYDELARWEKYAYGCNELVFHPIHRWYKGPFTPLFRRFLFSNIKITSKVTILAYIGTYYAIASAIPLTLANYCIIGWFTDDVDQFYLTSWKIFVGMAVVFNLLSPLGYAMLRHRLGQQTFFQSVLETVKWTPMFLLFFGGISYHLFKAICCHFFSIKMEWAATAKELEASGFRVGLDRIVRDFKVMYIIMIILVGGMVYLACFSPRGWRITDFAVIVPLANQVGCHMLFPFALGLF